MASDQLGRVYSGKDRCLTRCALGQAFNSESCICDCESAIERQASFYISKDREELRVQSIKRIVLASCPDADTVYENQKNTRRGEGASGRRGEGAKK